MGQIDDYLKRMQQELDEQKRKKGNQKKKDTPWANDELKLRAETARQTAELGYTPSKPGTTLFGQELGAGMRRNLASAGIGSYNYQDVYDSLLWNNRMQQEQQRMSDAYAHLEDDSWDAYSADPTYQAWLNQQQQIMQGQLDNTPLSGITRSNMEEYQKSLQGMSAAYDARRLQGGFAQNETEYNTARKLPEVYEHLNDTSWEGLQNDTEYQFYLAAMINMVDRELDTNVEPGSKRQEELEEYVGWLRDLQRAYGSRGELAREFTSENDYNNYMYASEATRKGLYGVEQSGRGHKAYYDQTVASMNAARQKWQDLQAKADDARLSADETAGPNAGGVWSDISDSERAAREREAQRAEQAAQAAYQEYRRSVLVMQYAKNQRYSDLPTRDDWAENVAAGKAKFAPLQQQVEANRAQLVQDVRMGNTEVAGLGDKQLAGEDWYTYRTPADNWSEEDKNTWYYLYNRSPEEAYQFAVDLNMTNRLNLRNSAMENIQNQSYSHPLLGALGGTATSVLSSPTGLWDYFGDLIQYGNTGLVMPRSELSARDYATALTSGAAERMNDAGTLPENWAVLGGKGLGDLYQLGNSVAESMAWGGLTRGMIALGAPEWMGAAVTNLGFFGNAASQTTQDYIAKGASPEQALLMGTAAGIAEAAGETFSIEHLVHLKDPVSFRRLLANTLKQGGVEASEEAFTTVLNTLADAWIMADKSEFNQNVQRYMDSGMSKADAEKKAWLEWAEGVAFDALGGFISGGASGMIYGGVGMASASANEYISMDRDALINMGLNQPKGSQAYMLAEKIQKEGVMSQMDAMRLKDLIGPEVEGIQSKQQEETYLDARKRLEKAGFSTEQAQEAATTVMREVMGEKQDISNETVRNVAKEMQTEREQALRQQYYMSQLNKSIRKIEKKTGQTISRESTPTQIQNLQFKSGETVSIDKATMKNGKLTLSYKQDGQQKTSSLSDMKLSTSQENAFREMTRILGDDAAYAYNLMDKKNVSTYRMVQYATQFSQIRDLFGARGATLERAMSSPLRSLMTDQQVMQAYNIGKRRGVQVDTRRASQMGTGKVSLNGGTVRSSDGNIQLKGVSDRSIVRSKDFKAMRLLARLAKVDVVMFEGAVDAEGKARDDIMGSYADGKVYINVNAGVEDGTQRMLLRTFSHELTHFMQQNAKQQYQDLKNAVIDYLSDKMGKDFNNLVQEKLEREPNISYQTAMDEVIADACEGMLADSKAVQQLMDKRPNLFKTIRDKFLAFLKRIYDEAGGVQDEGAKALRDEIERFQELWDKGLVAAVENREAASKEIKADVLESNAEVLTDIDPTEEEATVAMPDGDQYSIKSMRHDIAEGKMFEDLERYTDMSHEEVMELKKNLEKLTDLMALHRDILDMNETVGKDNRTFKPFKPNSDPLYTISLDFSTLCRKRLMTQYVIEKLQTELTDSQTGKRGRPLTAEEQLAVRDLMKEYGKQEKALKVACAMCYVEAARLKAPSQIQRFMRDPTEPMRRYFALRNSEFNAKVLEAQADFKEQHGYPRNATKSQMKPADVTALNKLSAKLRDNYQLTAEEQAEVDVAKSLPNETYLTAANLAKLADEQEGHPTIYDAYTYTIRSATRSKSLEADIPYYYGDSAKAVKDKFIEAVNRENGMRFSSWSDFQIQHMLDMMTAVIELSVRHCAMHGYTKFLEQVRIFGKTGMMFNMSGVPSATGLKSDGSLDFSTTDSVLVHGQSGEYDAVQAREDFPETAGLQCIGMSNAHIKALLASDIMDYIIPYHTSGMNATLRRMAQIYNWDDFTSFQNAKVDDKIKFNPKVHDKANWHKEPVFSEFFNAAKEVSNGYEPGEKGIVTMRRAADLYKQMCRERGLMPKFSWANSKVNADFSNDPNYWKLLIDRKMINQKTGSLIEQKPVRPDFDFGLIEKMVQAEVDAYDPGLQDRALNYVRDHLDELPQRIADLKKAGAVKKATTKKTSKAAKTLQAGPVAAVSEANAVGAAQMSLRPVSPVQPSSNAWSRTHDTAEAMKAYPNLWNVAAEESEKRNPTQIASTQGTYRNIYKILQREGFTGKILDASSGLGLGTKVGREEFGFDVDDIEPYPDASYKPKYTDYSKLHKKYDAIISSAVLNVLPQDQRDALVVKMGELLNPGGRMFITTRGKDVETLGNTGKNIHLGNMEWIETVKGSYQKGFTQAELKAYLEDALGPDFTVELSNAKNGGKFNNNTSIVVTKKAATTGGGTAQLSIKTIPGTNYQYVQADRQVLYGDDPEAWGEQLTRYINKNIREGKDVPLNTADGQILMLTATTAEKGAFRNDVREEGGNRRKMTDSEYEAKLNAEAHIDELVSISKDTRPGRRNVPDYNNLHGSLAQQGWRYREAFFMDFDEKYYKCTVSVAHGADGKVVYNVGEMEERAFPNITSSSDLTTGAYNGESSSADIVPDTSGDVNAQSSVRSRARGTRWENSEYADEYRTLTEGKDLDQLYDAWQKTGRELQKAQEDFRARKPEYDKRLDETVKSSKGSLEDRVEAFNRWADESGFNELDQKQIRLDRQYRMLRDAYENANDKKLEADERAAIEKSGLSEAEYFAKKAANVFGYTPHFYDAGYIVPNGKMLNFSGEKGKHFGVRGDDHRAIGQIFATTQGTAALNRFVGYGNIRIVAESPGLDMSASTEPTPEQYRTIKAFVSSCRDQGFFSVDFDNADGNTAGSLEYDGKISPDRVVADIKHFYQTGEIRGQGLSAFMSVRSNNKTDRELLRDSYETLQKQLEYAKLGERSLVKEVGRKQDSINRLTKEKQQALEAHHKALQQFEEQQQVVRDTLADLDTQVQAGTDPEAVTKLRAKLATQEKTLFTKLQALVKSEKSDELREIIKAERDLQMNLKSMEYEQQLAARDAQIQDIRERRDAKLKEVREARDQKIGELKEQNREKVSDIREANKAKALRGRIAKLWKEANDWVLNPSEKKHVPQELMKQTIQVLEAINMDSGKDTKKAEKLRAKLAEIRQRYDELKTSENVQLSAIYDENVAEMLKNMVTEVGDTPINEMSSEQLGYVYKTLQAMVKTAKTALKIRMGELEVEAAQVASAMTRETRSTSKPKTGFLSAYANWMLSAQRAFHKFGNFRQNSMWNRVYEMLNAGQLKQIQLQMEGSMIFDDLMNKKQYEKSYRDFIDPKKTVDVGLKDKNGNAVLLTHGMMVALYMHLTNDQNLKHVVYGGLTIPRLKDYYNGRKVKGSERSIRVGGILNEIDALNEQMAQTDDEAEILELEEKRDTLGAQFTMDLMDQIESKMTDYDREWIAASRELFDGFSKRELNKTAMDVYGIEKANVENYFPIWVDGDFLNTPFETVQKNLSLENVGFLKERVDSSKPIRLADVSDVAAAQVRNVSQYCGMMPVVRAFGKVWGKTETNYNDSLRKAVHEMYGQSGLDYIENLMADLNGARRQKQDRLTEFFNRMRGRMAQASLTLSLRTTLAQAASYPTAAAVVGWKALHKAFWRGGRSGRVISRADQDLIRKWSPLLYYRMKGYANTELGDIAGMNDKFTRVWKKARWLTGWIQAVDGATVGRLWYAAEYWVQDNMKDLKKGSDAYYEAVAQKFNQVVELTQPNYTTMQRPDVLRSPSTLLKQLTMFLTQRLQNFNIMYDAAATYSTLKADLKAGRNGVTAADVQQAAKECWTAFASQIVAAATLTAFKFLADAILHSMDNYRDDDDKELTAKSVSRELLDMFIDSLAGNVVGGGEAYDLIEHFAFGKTYYGLEVGTVATVGDVITSFTNALDKTIKDNAGWKDYEKLIRYAATAFGIPYNNAKKFVMGAVYWTQDAVNGQLLSFEAGVDRTTGIQANRLLRAYREMDGGKVNKILSEVPEDQQKNLYQAVRERIKDDYKKGDITFYEALRQLQKYGQASDQTMANFIKDEFNAGRISKKEAENQLVKYAGKTQESAEKAMNNAETKAETGMTYDQIDNAFHAGEITEQQAREALIKYGISEETANMKLEWWNYQKENPATDYTEGKYKTYYTKYKPLGMDFEQYQEFKAADSGGYYLHEKLQSGDMTPEQAEAIWDASYTGNKTLEQWYAAQEADKFGNGNGSVSQKEAGPWLKEQVDLGNYSMEEAEAIWAALIKSDKTFQDWLEKNK